MKILFTADVGLCQKASYWIMRDFHFINNCCRAGCDTWRIVTRDDIVTQRLERDIVNQVWQISCHTTSLQQLICYYLDYSPNGRFLVQETSPKAPVCRILISLQRWQHRARKEAKHFVSPHLIGPQLHQLDLASK